MDEKWHQRRNQKVSGNNENELTIIQNVWQTAKAVLRGKFIVIQAYLEKVETFQINNLTLRIQELEEQQQRHPRPSRRKEITNIGAELNDIETKGTILKINKSMSWFYWKDKQNWQSFKQTYQEEKKEDPNK